MDYAIKVKYASIELDEDSYGEGEVGYITEWDLDYLKGTTYKTAQELVNAVHEAESCFTTNVSDYIYMDDSTIQTDATVSYSDQYGIEEPSEKQWVQFRKGQINLANAHLWVRVEMVPVGLTHPMTEEEAEAFGIPIY